MLREGDWRSNNVQGPRVVYEICGTFFLGGRHWTGLGA